MSRPESARILVVDDEVNHAEATADALERPGWVVERVTSGSEALDRIRQGRFDVVVTDLKMAPVGGIEILKAARERDPRTQVIFISGYGSITDAVEAMQLGATNYFPKPLRIDALRAGVETAIESARAGHEPAGEGAGPDARVLRTIVGTSPDMLRVIEMVRTIAPTTATVLIFGENGTGKELVARAIHDLSPRRARPFVALNCGSLSEGILESELFGHEKGAFTGASAAREGRFEYADKGTLFLDEVGDMPLPLQVKLLRAIQEREVVRVGSNEPRKVDVRIIAATNKDLDAEIKAGRFREDLYYRLKVVSLRLPPLRDRRSDIPLLVETFVRQIASRHQKPVKPVDPAALRVLTNFHWPGNVRQLQNAVEHMILLSRGEALETRDIPEDVGQGARPGAALMSVDAFAGMTLDRVEEALIRRYLSEFAGNRARVARALGISERTLYRKLREYAIE